MTYIRVYRGGDRRRRRRQAVRTRAAVHLARLALGAGLPDGVFNVVTDAGPTGAALAGHPGIDKIASAATGRKIMKAATRNERRHPIPMGPAHQLMSHRPKRINV